MSKESITTYFKNFLKTRTYGFYITVAACLLTIITAIVYGAGYANTPRFISVPAIWIMAIAGVVGLCLAFTKLDELAPAVAGVGALIGFWLFAQVIYGYLIVVFAGIDLDGLEPRFVASVVFFVLALVTNIVAIFAKKSKEVNA